MEDQDNRSENEENAEIRKGGKRTSFLLLYFLFVFSPFLPKNFHSISRKNEASLYVGEKTRKASRFFRVYGKKLRRKKMETNIEKKRMMMMMMRGEKKWG